MTESQLRLAFLFIILCMGLLLGFVTNLLLLSVGLGVGFLLLCVIFMRTP